MAGTKTTLTPQQFTKFIRKFYPEAKIEESRILNLGRLYKNVRVILYQQGLWAVIIDHTTLGAEISIKNPSAGRTWAVIRPEEAKEFAAALVKATEIIEKVVLGWQVLRNE